MNFSFRNEGSVEKEIQFFIYFFDIKFSREIVNRWTVFRNKMSDSSEKTKNFNENLIKKKIALILQNFIEQVQFIFNQFCKCQGKPIQYIFYKYLPLYCVDQRHV